MAFTVLAINPIPCEVFDENRLDSYLMSNFNSKRGYVGNNQIIGGNLGNTSKKKSYNPEKVSMVIKKLSESCLVSEESIRSNIRKMLLKEAEFIDFNAGEDESSTYNRNDTNDPRKNLEDEQGEDNYEKQGMTNGEVTKENHFQMEKDQL